MAKKVGKVGKGIIEDYNHHRRDDKGIIINFFNSSDLSWICQKDSLLE